MQGVGRADILLYFKRPTTQQIRCPVNAYNKNFSRRAEQALRQVGGANSADHARFQAQISNDRQQVNTGRDASAVLGIFVR